jgi:hypothetical protein
MNRRLLKRHVGLLTLAASIALAASPASADAPTSEVPSAAQLAGLSPAELSLLDSGAPIDVVMDPTTGDIVSVTAADDSETPDISNHSICDSGNGCYLTNQTPYADQGFYGSSGTYDGNWPDRSEYTSGNYTVSACWTNGCGVKIGPASHVTLTSDVTGTSFTIY